jgi:hypothetical protein
MFAMERVNTHCGISHGQYTVIRPVYIINVYKLKVASED